MDDCYFDELTKGLVSAIGSRRAALRLITGSGLGVLAARFGGTQAALAKNKGKRKNKKKHTDRNKDKKQKKQPVECAGDSDCAACERCRGGQCDPGVAALCDASRCQEPICNTTTNSWECRRTCLHADAVCCNGQCFASCSNGCEINDSCDACTTAPAGKEYCPGGDICVDQCPAGEHLDHDTCQCETCAHRCDPETGAMSQVGCGAGETCVFGNCQRACPPWWDAAATQLCCGGSRFNPQCVCIEPGATCGGICTG